MSTHDKSGRPWAKLSKLHAGDMISIDDGFTCQKAGRYMLHYSKSGLWFMCDEGRHYIIGQTDDGEHLIGIYKS